jgi:hypothetical protein
MDSKRGILLRGIRTSGCALAFASLLSGFAGAQTRTGTTTLGITVERHLAILLPADASGVVRLSARLETVEGPAALGNASPALITVEDSRSIAPASSGKARVAVTVFEP